jgi:hypothetical protein
MDNIEAIAKDIVDAAYKVHKSLVLAFWSLPISNAMRTNFVSVVDKY